MQNYKKNVQIATKKVYPYLKIPKISKSRLLQFSHRSLIIQLSRLRVWLEKLAPMPMILLPSALNGIG